MMTEEEIIEGTNKPSNMEDMNMKEKNQKSVIERHKKGKDNIIPRKIHEKAWKIAKALMEPKTKPLKDYRVN